MIEEPDRNRLRDMRTYAEHAFALLGDRSVDDLEADLRSRFAVIHCIEIVGEAAAKVSKSARAEIPSLAWNRIVGMRNALIHGYPDINLKRVVNAVRDELPALVAAINDVLGEKDQ